MTLFSYRWWTHHLKKDGISLPNQLGFFKDQDQDTSRMPTSPAFGGKLPTKQSSTNDFWWILISDCFSLRVVWRLNKVVLLLLDDLHKGFPILPCGKVCSLDFLWIWLLYSACIISIHACNLWLWIIIQGIQQLEKHHLSMIPSLLLPYISLKENMIHV